MVGLTCPTCSWYAKRSKSRDDGKLFSIARLRAKTKVLEILVRDMLFADDAALAIHTEEALRRLIGCFSQSCKDFDLTISIKKTNVSAQDVNQNPSIKIDDHTLDVMNEFTYLDSTIFMNLCLDTEINKGKPQLPWPNWPNGCGRTASSHKTPRCQSTKHASESTLLCGSETWTTYMLRCLRRIPDIKWQNHIPNDDVLTCTGVPSMYSLLSQRRLRWIGHVRCMEDGPISNEAQWGACINYLRDDVIAHK